MALTATANEKVKLDILHVLKMQNCKTFLQSFNRMNLSYEVRPKDKNVIQEIVKFVRLNYAKSSGIVYCLSKKVFIS
jgi:superfamily II DNA helicase RecQ